MLYFTSDFHFSHFNIIKYCNRPFKTIADMNDTIINNINTIISNNDILYFLGDFAFTKQYEYTVHLMMRLHGKKVCIIGNHDRKAFFVQMLSDRIISELHNSTDIEYNGYKFHLSHRPNQEIKTPQLHGHLHSEHSVIINNKLDVGVDGHKFMPWSIENIIEIFS